MVIKRLPNNTVIGYFERGDLFTFEQMGYDVSDGASVDLEGVLLAYHTIRAFFRDAAALESAKNLRDFPSVWKSTPSGVMQNASTEG